MPPRKSTRRNKSSSTTPVVAHELPAPEPKTEPELADDLKVEEPVVQEDVSDPNPAGGGVSSESMAKEEARNEDDVVNEDLRLGSEAVDEGKQAETEIIEEEEEEEEEEELQESEDVEEENQGEDEEINSAQEEMTAVQVVDDLLVVNNGDIKGTTEMVPLQVSAQAVITQTSNDNKTALAVEDMVNLDDDSEDESDDDCEGDDANNEGDDDQDPSFIVQDSSLDNKKEKGAEIYVGKLDKTAVEEDLVNVFQQFGELKSTRIVRKPNTNKSKGFGFVRFASVDQAKHALSELKDGVEVKGKRVVISASQDNDTLCLENICKTWNKEQVLQKLNEYGIEHIEVLHLQEDPKFDRKNTGFAFLEFNTHSDAVEAFKRLKKPDVVFGCDISAKVAFAQIPNQSVDGDQQGNEVHLEGFTEDWTEEKVKDICQNYGEILKINLRPSTRNKRKDFGFVTFSSSESALACVVGINNTVIEGESKVKASIAKPQRKGLVQKKDFHGGFKVEKQSENSNKKSQPKSSKMKGGLNTQQTKINKKYPSKNKQQKGPLKKDGGRSKEAESSKMKGDNDSQHGNRKRKASSEQKLNARDLGTPKKPNNGGQGQNSQSVAKAGGQKRKKASGNEVREDRGNRNAQGKKPFKKQKGNMYGRERDNSRKLKSDTHTRRGHDDYRNSTRYADPYTPKYAASASNAYHVTSDRRYKEMEPHAGYIEPAFANRSQVYSGYAQPVVRTPHSQYQTMYHTQSQLYPRYLDRPVVTQPHRGYIDTAVAHEAQPYRDYRSSAAVQFARTPYDSGHARVVRHDDRGAGGLTYVGGPSHPASQVPDHTSYYQAGGSYSGAYGSRGGYY